MRSEQSRRDRLAHTRAVTMPPFDEVVESIERDVDRTRVAEAMEKLTELQRQAVELAYFGRYTYRDVAEILGAPLGTVKIRLRAALHRLSVELGEPT